MTKDQEGQFWKLLDKAGQIPTTIDKELAQARASNPPVNENLHVIRAHNATADLGVALAALEAWGKDVFPVPAPAPLERLQEPQLSKMIFYVKHAQWNAEAQALSDALGSNFNWYVNAYGPSGVYYNPADWDRVP